MKSATMGIMILAIFTVSAALASDRPAGDAAPLSKISHDLERTGYIVIEAEYEKQVWEVEVVKAGECFEIKIDAQTRKQLSIKPESKRKAFPVEDAKPLSKIAKQLEKAGYLLAEAEYKPKRSVWDIEAYRGDTKFELRVDPGTGEVLRERIDD